MTKYIGRRIGAGIGKEGTRGTADAIDFWLPWTALNHSDKANYAIDESAQNTILDSVGAEIVAEWAEGGYDALIGSEHFGLVLLSLLGAVADAELGGDAGVYDHTYTLAETATHQALTFGIDQANGDKAYALAMVQSLSLNFDRGKILDYTCNLMSKKGATAALTPAAVSEARFRPQDFTFKIAANLAGLGAANAVEVKSLTLDIAKNVELDDVLGDVAPTDILNKQVEVSGKVMLTYDATTYEDYFRGNTQRALEIELANSDVTIGAASNPTLTIQLAKVAFNEISFERGLNDIVAHELSFKALYSTSDSSFGNIVLRNEVDAY